MKNTKIGYLYRDASNWKQWNECIVEGIIDADGIKAIMDSLDEGEYFIPRAVGMPETRFAKWTDDDHAYFELNSDDFSYTDDEPDTGIDAETLIARFKAAAGNWHALENGGTVEDLKQKEGGQE